MTKLNWDGVGERVYETGTSHGVLFIPNPQGVYDNGVAWNGLTTVTSSPSGAESNPQYADNMKYVNLVSAEEYGATLEAFTYPDEFLQFDGVAKVHGVQIGQQNRRPFGLSWQTLIGNDLVGTDFGYKIHLAYNVQAAPSESAYTTVNDSPEAMGMSWELTTTPVAVGTIDGVSYKPTAKLTISSLDHTPEEMAAVEQILYGTASVNPRLPLPGELVAIFSGSLTEVETADPTFNATTDTVTIPVTPGVVYLVDGEPVTGSFVITEDTTVTARAAEGYKFSETSDDDWVFRV